MTTLILAVGIVLIVVVVLFLATTTEPSRRAVEPVHKPVLFL